MRIDMTDEADLSSGPTATRMEVSISVVRTSQPPNPRTRAKSKPLFSSIYLQRVSWKTVENQWDYKIEAMKVVSLEYKKVFTKRIFGSVWIRPLAWIGNWSHVSICCSGMAKVPSWFGRSTRFRTSKHHVWLQQVFHVLGILNSPGTFAKVLYLEQERDRYSKLMSVHKMKYAY